MRKSYGDVAAVDGVSFEIARGETFGLLGPNGAGKTTTIHTLIGVLKPDGGGVEIDGTGDPTRSEVRRNIGIAPQEMAVYHELTGRENLAFFGRLYGLNGRRLKERVDWAIRFASLAEFSGRRAGTYSGGMLRRLNMACALIADPTVILFDEPTVGVDPQSRNHIFENIELLKRENRTIIYTTHYMEEAQRLCDRVAVMDRGSILDLGTVDELINRHGGGSVVTAELEKIPDRPDELPGTLEGDCLHFESSRPLEEIARLSDRGVRFRTLRVERPNLESVFLALTGRRLRD